MQSFKAVIVQSHECAIFLRTKYRKHGHLFYVFVTIWQFIFQFLQVFMAVMQHWNSPVGTRVCHSLYWAVVKNGNFKIEQKQKTEHTTVVKIYFVHRCPLPWHYWVHGFAFSLHIEQAFIQHFKKRFISSEYLLKA